jgi:outer membrane receptor protein involved in Fe transport
MRIISRTATWHAKVENGQRSITSAGLSVGLLCACLSIGVEARERPWRAPPSARPPMATQHVAQATQMPFSIAPQSLDTALAVFGEQSRWQVLYDSDMTAGKRSAAVSGTHTPEAALRLLLAGTGLGFRATGPTAVTLERPSPHGSEALQTAPVPVGTQQPPAGEVLPAEPITVLEAADNYGRLLESTANVGLTTSATRLPVSSRETPWSVGVISEQLIEEVGARNPSELSAYVSGVSRESDIARAGNFFIRGFPVGTRATIDGFRNPRGFGSSSTFTVSDLALYERVEILKGQSAILYGQGEPGGMVNYITKKPQFERLHSVEAGISRDDGGLRYAQFEFINSNLTNNVRSILSDESALSPALARSTTSRRGSRSMRAGRGRSNRILAWAPMATSSHPGTASSSRSASRAMPSTSVSTTPWRYST